MALTSYLLLRLFHFAHMALATSAKHPSSSALKMVVGGYSNHISVIEFDSTTRESSNLSTSPPDSAGSSPSFITFSPDGQYLFVANEVGSYLGKKNTGSVTSFKLNSDASLTNISTSFTAADPVALAVSRDGKNLIAAEYTGGSWSRHALDQQGRFTSDTPIQSRDYHGSGPNKQRQDKSYIHQVLYSPSGDLVFFVDLGGDAVYIHRVDQSTGGLGDIAHTIKLPPGTGPRHLTMVENHSGVLDIYLITELSNKIFTIRLVDQYAGLRSVIRQELSTLPPEIQNAASLAAGEILISADGRFVYGSNRQTDFTKPITDNSIVKFKRDLKSGLLIEDRHSSSPFWFPLTIGGKTPRHFSFSNDKQQSFLVVGCQQSDTVLIFRRHFEDGSLKMLSSTFFSKPAVQLFLPNHHHWSPKT